MPAPPRRWRHIILNTKNTWLHGDDRGFRDRKHRIHSSGDYKHRPPEDEHPGLHRYFEERAGAEVVFEQDVRPVIGRAIIASLHAMTYRPTCIAVGKVHAHFLVHLPNDYGLVKRVVGKAKHDASCAASSVLQGAVWAEGGTFKLIDNDAHLTNACDYILFDQGPRAWTWSEQDSSEEGTYGRKRAGRR
jgi:hypothetical protein